MTRGPASEGPLEIGTRCNFRLKCDSHGDSTVHEKKKKKSIESIKRQLLCMGLQLRMKMRVKLILKALYAC